MAVGTCTITEELHDGVKKIKFAWTSGTIADDGVVPDTDTVRAYSGKVERFITDPTDGPTDDYDITIKDEDGYDVLAGAGANRDTTNTEQVLASSLGIVAGDKLTFAVANAGSAKSGVAYLYLR